MLFEDLRSLCQNKPPSNHFRTCLSALDPDDDMSWMYLRNHLQLTYGSVEKWAFTCAEHTREFHPNIDTYRSAFQVYYDFRTCLDVALPMLRGIDRASIDLLTYDQMSMPDLPDRAFFLDMILNDEIKSLLGIHLEDSWELEWAYLAFQKFWRRVTQHRPEFDRKTFQNLFMSPNLPAFGGYGFNDGVAVRNFARYYYSLVMREDFDRLMLEMLFDPDNSEFLKTRTLGNI